MQLTKTMKGEPVKHDELFKMSFEILKTLINDTSHKIDLDLHSVDGINKKMIKIYKCLANANHEILSNKTSEYGKENYWAHIDD